MKKNANSVTNKDMLSEPSPKTTAVMNGKEKKKQALGKDFYLGSEGGVDYTRLRDLLTARDLREADLETGRLMLKVAGRENGKYLDVESINKFPCSDLLTVNQLWLKYTDGRYGFSVQKTIYEEAKKDYRRFCHSVGWTEYISGDEKTYGDFLGGNWSEHLRYKLKFPYAPKGELPSLQAIPRGYLPSLRILAKYSSSNRNGWFYVLEIGKGVGGGIFYSNDPNVIYYETYCLEALFSRLDTCNLQDNSEQVQQTTSLLLKQTKLQNSEVLSNPNLSPDFQRVQTLFGHTRSIYSVAISPDGQILASGSRDGAIKLWQLSTAQEIFTLNATKGTTHVNLTVMAFSPDGQSLASASWGDGTIRLWNVSTGENLRALKGPTCKIQCVAFSPDGQQIASVFGNGTIKLWNVNDGQELSLVRDSIGSPYSAAFSPDGQILASGGWEGGYNTIKLWNVKDGQILRTLKHHTKWVSAVAFSPDGQTLASGSHDKTIKLWNVSTGQNLRILAGHTKVINSVVFSSDGQTLASASVDKTIKLWNVNTGQELCTLSSHMSGVESIAFSPDGRTLVSGSVDKTIIIWQCS